MALAVNQLRFLARRLIAKTDEEAADRVGVAGRTVRDWKQTDPEFKARYEALGDDGIELARDILRHHLGEAAVVLAEGMQATDRGKPDHQTRITAAKAMLAGLGVLTEKRQISGDPDNPVVIVTADQLHEASKRARSKPPTD